VTKRPPKTPGTFTSKIHDLAAVASEHVTKPGFYYQAVHHDHDCPAIQTQSLADCTCEPTTAPPVHVKTVEDWLKQARKNRPA
jgi:hypothetical protein